MPLGHAADYLFLGLFVILLAYLLVPDGLFIMPTLSDLQKLVDNMKRAQSVVNRAAGDAVKHSAIMDAFEKRMDLNHENMTKIEEYEKLMAQMDTGDNGGPALDAHFPLTPQGGFSATGQPPTETATSVTASSTKGLGRFDH